MALPTDITKWGPQDAKAVVADTLHADFELNRLMLEDKDFWGPDGKFWAGERTDPATDRAVLANIKPQFAADDVLSEVMENFADGLLQREASIILDPVSPAEEGTKAEEDQQKDIEAKLRAFAVWWDAAKYWRKVRATLKRSRYAPLRDKPTVGRGALRFWVPPGNTTTQPAQNGTPITTLPTGKTLAEAFALVAVDDVRPDAAALYTDPTTRQQAAVILTKTTEGKEEAEIWTLEGLGEQKKTVRRLLGTSTARGGTPDLTLNLRGKLPLAEVEGDVLITPPVRQLQSILNLITTTLPRTVTTAGFKERYITNAEPPGMWLPYAPVNSPPLAKETISNQTYYKHRIDWKLGAHITTEILGVEIPGKPGEPVTYATPGVTIAEPTDPAFVTKAQEAGEALIYKRCRQGHLANTSTAEASGLAYAQARSQFEADLGNMKGPAEGLIRDSLEILCAYAALMSQEAAELLANYRIVVTLHPHAGPITPDEARLAMELRNGRVIAPETAMARVGVEDTAAELAAIEADPMQQLEVTKKRLEVYAAAVAAGQEAGVAAWLAGFSVEETKALVTNQVPTPEAKPKLEAA